MYFCASEFHLEYPLKASRTSFFLSFFGFVTKGKSLVPPPLHPQIKTETKRNTSSGSPFPFELIFIT